MAPLTVVIKLGSSSILHPEPPHFPQLATLSALVETCVSLRSAGHRVVIVSSGAIGMGLHRMQLPATTTTSTPTSAPSLNSTTAPATNPHSSGGGAATPIGGSGSTSTSKKRTMGEKQALAAIGQGRLIALWDQLFGMLKQPIAQILITRNDIADRSRYLNATTTLSTLLSMGVIPIINENDTISVSEIFHINKFGDNDTLSAIAAGMCQADYLFLCTDVEGLYEDNPRKVPGARRVKICRDIEVVRKMVSTSTLGSSLGTGGMETKLIAAELATGAGCATVITLGSAPHRILEIVQNHQAHHHHISSPRTDSMSASTPNLPPKSTMGSEQPLNAASEFLARTSSHPDLSSSHSHPSDSESDLPSTTTKASIPKNEGPELAAVEFASPTDTPPHTLFTPRARPLTSRRFWVLHGLTPRGTVYIDEGAYRAIVSKRASTGSKNASDTNTNARATGGGGGGGGNGGRLLPAGVVRVEGTFAAGQAVRVCVIKRPNNHSRQGNSGAAAREQETTTSKTRTTSRGRSGIVRPVDSGALQQQQQGGQTDDSNESSPAGSRVASLSRNRLTRGSSRSRLGEEQGEGQRGARQGEERDEEAEEEEVIEFGRGLTNYNSAEIDRVKGMRSSDIEKVLGYYEAEHVVESIVELRVEQKVE